MEKVSTTTSYSDTVSGLDIVFDVSRGGSGNRITGRIMKPSGDKKEFAGNFDTRPDGGMSLYLTPTLTTGERIAVSQKILEGIDSLNADVQPVN